MRLLSLLCCLATLFTYALAGHVVEFESLDELEKTVANAKKGTLVKFYASWCGHCKNLAPIYEELGDHFADDEDIIIARVDADRHSKVGSKFDIRGYPTLKWFPSGAEEPEQYTSGRDLESLVDFVSAKTGVKKPVQVVETPSVVVELDSTTFDSVVLDEEKDVLVEFYADWCSYCKRLRPIYEQVAVALANEPGVVVAKINADIHRDIGMLQGISGFPTIKLFKRGAKREPLSFEGSRTTEGIVNFVNEECDTRRGPNGRLLPSAGTIPSLDKLAAEFTAAPQDSRPVIAEKVKQLVMEGTNKWYKYYGSVFEKTLKDPSWPVREFARLGRILKKGSLSDSKHDDITIRRNILRAFEHETTENEEL
ncbi:protein disulfide isomerase [Schizosaccharomyces japonicus yFS275]|uniref:protein disulfide-isomerase n=1 Tax=Schizosaccharomyces japonicus (strain yFS275 / FY16936) TaxID=402676 RepID=B6K461_SCHJY|nr:protein disulfide isomerase [Schizosaccharomyces japonicus yFS275]EEB08268.1 protein disulfide isomerase [Schizosaccharomyces japonicus yFS275]